MKASLPDELEGGHFARKQLYCQDWLISWSHRRRFQTGLRIATTFAGRRVLDYGCGDGTFLAMLMSSPTAPARAVGAELDPAVVSECQRRMKHLAGLSFFGQADVAGPAHDGQYDAVFCMEVLEHVVDVAGLLRTLHRLLDPSGRLVVSVPVETGLPLIVKQVVRWFAGVRGLGDYPGMAPYSFRELWAGLVAAGSQHMPRTIHVGEDGFSIHDHRGFNWRVMRDKVGEMFEIERTIASPLAFLGPGLASQVWLVARKR